MRSKLGNVELRIYCRIHTCPHVFSHTCLRHTPQHLSHSINMCPSLFFAGGTPFAQLGDDELRIYRRILRCKYAWPDTPAGHDISADARDLVAQLLLEDPKERLGMVGWVCGLVCLCCLVVWFGFTPWFQSLSLGGIFFMNLLNPGDASALHWCSSCFYRRMQIIACSAWAGNRCQLIIRLKLVRSRTGLKLIAVEFDRWQNDRCQVVRSHAGVSGCPKPFLAVLLYVCFNPYQMFYTFYDSCFCM